MKVTAFECSDFRNIRFARIEPCEGINVIYGNNGQGKTSLLEGIALFSGLRSFRGARNNQMIRTGEQLARLQMCFRAENREQEAAITLESDKKLLTLNGVKEETATVMIGKFFCTVFSPDRMSLVTGAADERRKFLDAAISQCRPRFASVLYSYNKIVNQRNALLKSLQSGGGSGVLDVWDSVLASYAAEIALRRRDFLAGLSETAAEVYDGISSGREQLSLKYVCFCRSCDGMTAADIEKDYTAGLLSAREHDIELGYTTKGPHRDDILIELSGKDIRPYGSNGQKRSAVLSMKLAEAEQLSRLTDERPIALLDDVMSELDKSRQRYLLNKLDDCQVFITCCDPAPLELMETGARFLIDGGGILE